LREYLAILTRPQQFSITLPIATVVQDIRYLQNRFLVAEDGSQITARLLALIAEIPVGGKQVHDANIVATMLVYGISQLLTHNITRCATYCFVTQVRCMND
jgi:predicted nucleic acid-binding protein